jgi:hypothetical protein
MKGWRFESHRHMLAAKGITTRVYAAYAPRTAAQINADLVVVQARKGRKQGFGDWISNVTDESQLKQELAGVEGRDIVANRHGLIAVMREQWRDDDAAKEKADSDAVERADRQPSILQGDVEVVPKTEEIDLLERSRRAEEDDRLQRERDYQRIEAEMKRTRRGV